MKSSSATMMAVLLVAAMVSVGLAMTNEERRAKGSPKYMTPGGMAHVVEEKIKQVVEERAFNATLAAKIAAQGDSMAQTQSEQVNSVPSERTPPNKQPELKAAAVGGLAIATTRVKAAPSTGPLISEPLAAREKPRAKTTSYDMSWMEEFSSKVAAVPTTRSSPVPQATSLVDGANVNKGGVMTHTPPGFHTPGGISAPGGPPTPPGINTRAIAMEGAMHIDPGWSKEFDKNHLGWSRLFHKFDKNHNALSEEEFKAAIVEGLHKPECAECFVKFDKDGDKAIDLAEFNFAMLEGKKMFGCDQCKK